MKKNYLVLLVFLVGFNSVSFAQWINSIAVSPPTPTTNDSIRVYVDCSFPSGGCDPYLPSVYIFGNTIYGNALHCLGMLTVICSYTDTFTMPPLPAGNYKFHMQLNAGIGPAPCTAGIVPGPVDSVSFIITQATGIPPVNGNASCQILSDAAEGTITVLLPAGLPAARLQIYAYDGRAVFSTPVTGSVSVFRPHLPSGTYVASVETGDARYRKKIIVFN